MSGSKLVDFDKIIVIDYRCYIFYLNIKELFNIETSTYNQPERRLLNSNNEFHRENSKKNIKIH